MNAAADPDGLAAVLRVGAARLESRRWGEPTSPTLVLLHEGLGSVGLWRHFPRLLSERTGLGVFAWSRLGYGQSDPALLPRPLDYMQCEAAMSVGAVLDEAGVRDCILIGHSDGATIAALYAGEARDDRVSALVLIAPHYFVEEVAVAEIARARVAYEQGDLRARLARHHRHVDSAFRGWNDAWLDPGFPAVLDLGGALAGVRVPILQIQGEDDMYGTVAQPRFAEAHATCSVQTVMIAGARHAPHLESPAPTMDAISAFVAQVPRWRSKNRPIS